MPDTFVDQVGQRRITDGDEAAWVDPVRDIAEFLRPELRKLRKDSFPEQVRVELGDAVFGASHTSPRPVRPPHRRAGELARLSYRYSRP